MSDAKQWLREAAQRIAEHNDGTWCSKSWRIIADAFELVGDDPDAKLDLVAVMFDEIASLRQRIADDDSDHKMFVALAGNELQMVAININSKALDCGLPVAEKWDAESIMRVQDAVFNDLCGKNDGYALEVDQLNEKIERLETLLREAGDFMTPHAHADWKKKIEAAKAGGRE